MAENYYRFLQEAGIDTTPFVDEHNVSAWAQYTIQVEGREALQQRLTEQGIPTAVHYPIPLNHQPAVRDRDVELLIGDSASDRVVSLPMHAYLNTGSIKQIVQAISAV